MPVEVLMIEDNQGDVILVQEAVQSLGLPYTMRVVHNGVEALEYLRRQGMHTAACRPDLIILDLQLPKKTGVEVLDEVDPDPAFRNIPIVVLSSSVGELCTVWTHGAHSCKYVVKPSTFAGYRDLARMIEAFRLTSPKEGKQ